MSSTLSLSALAIQADGLNQESGLSNRPASELLQKVQGKDPNARMAAAHQAGPEGAGAVQPLAKLLTNEDKGIAKAADEALKRIVHYAARPGAGKDARAVSTELVKLTDASQPREVRRKAVRLLEFVGKDEAVPALAKLLTDADLQEDARLTLERIPGRASAKALEQATRSASSEFRPNLEQSLRHRRSSLKTIGTEA
jgi:HEAT repeat protein